MILIDTGYFIALYDPHDALHQRANAWAKAIHEPLLVTEYVSWETVNHFSAPPDRPRAHSILALVQTATDVEFIPASPDLSTEGVRLHRERADKSWSLTDCISFVVMQQRNVLRALSYDHHFEQAGFDALLRRDPP